MCEAAPIEEDLLQGECDARSRGRAPLWETGG